MRVFIQPKKISSNEEELENLITKKPNENTVTLGPDERQAGDLGFVLTLEHQFGTDNFFFLFHNRTQGLLIHLYNLTNDFLTFKTLL